MACASDQNLPVPVRPVVARTAAATRAWMRLAGHPSARLRFGTSRLNNFDALRLLAALSVLISHSFAIAGNAQPAVGALDLGSIGVMVFFGISGFLIAQSWTFDADPRRFLAKRALRIMPALLMLLLLSVLVMGPLVSTLGARDYLASADAWLYLLRNAALVTTHELPGVFTGLEYPRQVNASLWTLHYEAIAYLAVLGFGLLGALRRPWLAPAVAVVLIVAPHGLVPWTSGLFVLQAFAVGTSLYLLREQIPWHPAIVAVSLAVWAVAPHGLQLLLTVAVIPYASIFLAYRGPAWLRRLTTRGDFSYGLYLFAWPVGQLTALAWGGDVTPGVVIAVSLPLTYALAAASWFWLEKPALALKSRLGGRTTEPRVEARSAIDVVTGVLARRRRRRSAEAPVTAVAADAEESVLAVDRAR